MLSMVMVCDNKLLLNTQITDNEINAMIKLGGGNVFHDGWFWLAFTYKDMQITSINQATRIPKLVSRNNIYVSFYESKPTSRPSGALVVFNSIFLSTSGP